MKSEVASATNAVIICITAFSLYIFIENCVLDLSSFELNEHNEMTLNKVPYNEHRAQGPCHCGPQNSLFFGALLVSYGKISLAKYTVAQSIKYHITNLAYFLFITHTLAGFCLSQSLCNDTCYTYTCTCIS